jgi:hypothetical protein
MPRHGLRHRRRIGSGLFEGHPVVVEGRPAIGRHLTASSYKINELANLNPSILNNLLNTIADLVKKSKPRLRSIHATISKNN